MQKKYILITAIAILIGAVAAYLYNPTTQTQAAQGIVTPDCGQVQPIEMGIHWSDGSGTFSAQSVGITAEQAIAIASEKTIVRGQLPAPVTKTQRVSYSNDNRGVASSGNVDDDDVADANAISQGVPVWIVTFCGITDHVSRPRGTENSGNVRVRNEWNVVVNAVNGQIIEEFSER